ncbi:hypothetical protein CERSUDRAFT_120045 [Gelatoporia subvermispora B]|uniref:Uncharacterized protein n=1 Tax=Ceriporiopsis subvermispora (strain B) TaxID=914234 RepID=M2P764_CERS8|nr:hypothetical protein CERSUDRAFT_120045 [Gelatoporia subvermispora B]
MSRQYDSATNSGHPTPRSSRPSSASRPSPNDSEHDAQPHEYPAVTGRPSPQNVSSSSEGYPSWLPKRPPPPAPRSTIQSSIAGMFSEPGPSSEPYPVGRKPTPRSVRIVSLQGSSQVDKGSRAQREPTEQSRAFSGPAHARTTGVPQPPRPRFRTPVFNLDFLRSPSWKTRLLFYSFPVLVFAHVPLQTFFDFNAVFILLLVAKFPNPAAPGVPGSGRGWALGAAAYIACWLTWILAVFIVYEVVYSFVRRWRVKRPLILPIYLSTSAYNLASMTSYSNFCFLRSIRASAFSREFGSFRDGVAETAYYYSQNLPTVALLVPRAALALTLLLTFSRPQPDDLALADAGISSRDGTFFRPDGSLTRYARGVLIANAAWTAWRMLVLFMSWICLWIVSGQACGGLCGPRYRWEEEDAEKTVSVFSDTASYMDALPWAWKERTLYRVKYIYELCRVDNKTRPGADAEKRGPSEPFEGIDRVLAAVGLPSGQQAARRPILSDNLFESPAMMEHPELIDEQVDKAEKVEPQEVVPPEPALQPREKPDVGPSSPLMKLPYPFTGRGAQISSEDVVPFPPSPALPDDEYPGAPQAHENEEDEDEDDEDEEEEDDEDEEEGEEEDSEEPSSGRRTSGSMSSLGRPVTSRYPFQFRRPARGSVSSASHNSPYGQHQSTPRSTQTRSTQSPSAQTRSTQSRSTRYSRSTQSTGNRESTDSPMSGSSSQAQSPAASNFSGSAIPMPPRHPQGQRRARAGTVPALPQGSPSPISFQGRPRARTRAGSLAAETTMAFGPVPVPTYESDGDHAHDESLLDVPEAEGSVEEAEQHDSVGLLSAAPSPRASLVNLRNRRSSLRRAGSRSRSHSRSRTDSATSRTDSTRSRVQSLIQSIGAASRSSVDLVRTRANSMARLSDAHITSSSSEAILSSAENHTFGHPLRSQWHAEETRENSANEEGRRSPADAPVQSSGQGSGSDADQSSQSQELHTAPSTISRSAPSEMPSESGTSVRTERIGIPIAGQRAVPPVESRPDLSTAPQSFITAPATTEGTTDSSGRTPQSWGTERFGGEAWHPA